MAANSVIIDLEIRGRQARQALEGIESGMTDLRKETGRSQSLVRKSTGAMSSGFGRASQNVQGTTTAVTNLNRIVQDAPFGTMGVANNIEPFIQSFQNMGDEATTTRQKMKMLLSSAFTGPGALITIVSIVTAALTAIQMGLFDWGDEADSTDKQMEKLMDTMDEFISEQADMQGDNVFDPLGQATTQSKLDQVEALRNELELLFNLRTEAEELRVKISDINTELSSRGGLQPGSGVLGNASNLNRLGDELDSVNDRILKQEKLFGELSKAEEESIRKKIDDLEATANLNQAFIRLNPALQRQMEINKLLRPVLRDVELGLSGAASELDDIIKKWSQQASSIRSSIEAGELQGQKLEEQKNILMSLVEALDRARKAQEGLSKEQEKASGFGGFQYSLRSAQRSNTSVRPQAPQDMILGASGNTFAAGDGSKFGTDYQIGIEFGRTFREIEKFSEKLDLSEKEIEDLKLALGDTSDSGQQSMEALAGAANIVGNALAQAIIRGEELEGVLKSLAAQLASRAIITGLGALLTGGASLGGGTFLSAMFGGFAHGTDGGFPGIGITGERGKELVVAPPMSSIITNENIERMSRMQSQARQGIGSSMHSLNFDSIAEEVRKGIEQANIIAPVSIQRVDEELNENRKIEGAIGNNI